MGTKRYQRLVGSIYGYFANSTSRQARLKEMTDILETDCEAQIYPCGWSSWWSTTPGYGHCPLQQPLQGASRIIGKILALPKELVDTEGNSVPTASCLQEMEDIVAKFDEIMPNDKWLIRKLEVKCI
ncbi:hypothetical protein Bbelb_047930 [Branchiostoma belcheri]|nr:hypothetical protein Bbelb_047930 [Branchiostoma belcheri]